jgi:hypothetical protein
MLLPEPRAGTGDGTTQTNKTTICHRMFLIELKHYYILYGKTKPPFAGPRELVVSTEMLRSDFGVQGFRLSLDSRS